MICSIPDCGKRARRRGWCSMHYARWYRHGDPYATYAIRAVQNSYLVVDTIVRVGMIDRTGGRSEAIIDVSDLNLVASIPGTWYAASANKATYPITYIRDASGGRMIRMHRFILGLEDPTIVVDHINGDTFDNRRSNLRTCTHRQNACNQRMGRGGTSQFRGVSWDATNRRWRAQIKVDGKTMCLGRYDVESEAAQAYDRAAVAHHGEFATLNFPHDDLSCGHTWRPADEDAA